MWPIGVEPMKRTKVYLDTSFINYLVATRLPEKMQESLDLWNVFVSSDRFEVVLSEIVYEELHACYEPKRSRLLEKLAEIEFQIVSETDEITALANRYLEFDILSQKDFYDLLHIAHATVNGCKWIISWNFKHFVNFKTMDRVNAVNLIEEYDPVKIASPPMLLGELENE